MRTATTVVGIDVPRDWPDGFCFPGERRFRLANSAEGHKLLVAAIREMPGPVKIGFEATGGQEWVLWATLVAAEIDAALIAWFMLFRPETGRGLPSENLRIFRALTARRAQIVDMRKRLSA